MEGRNPLSSKHIEEDWADPVSPEEQQEEKIKKKVVRISRAIAARGEIDAVQAEIHRLSMKFKVTRRVGEKYYSSKLLWKKACPVTMLRVDKGWTIKELGERTGESVGVISHVCNGTKPMSTRMGRVVAKALNVSALGLYHSYLVWRAMEPTLHMRDVERMAKAACQRVNPVYLRIRGLGLNPGNVTLDGLSRASLLRYMAQPDYDGHINTLSVLAEGLGVSASHLLHELTKWRSAFAGLGPEDTLAMSLEMEAELDRGLM